MKQGGALPGWLNRLWWVLMPGVLFIAAKVVWWTARGPKQSTRLVAIAGGVTGLVVSWLVVSLALIHIWMLVAAALALRRRTRLQRQERWKLLATGLVLLVAYSPLLAALVVRIFAAG